MIENLENVSDEVLHSFEELLCITEPVLANLESNEREVWQKLSAAVADEIMARDHQRDQGRPEHFAGYEKLTEVVPGVFVDTEKGSGVYIVDDEGEVACWVDTEWQEDPLAVTACVNACLLAAVKGPVAVRRMLHEAGGNPLDELIRETYARNYGPDR